MDKKTKNEYQKAYRLKNNNIQTKKYEKTKNGFLMRAYRNMYSRVNGIQKSKFHLYKNKTIIEKELFYEWSKANETFHELFKQWEISNYERRLTPSIDRIDSSKGYELENMEWVPFYINCQRGGQSKKF